MAHARTITQEDVESPRPVYAVWEITMRCDHACAHCGSRAAVARPDELTREELMDVAGQLIRIGSREVTLIGGEAYLRPEIFEITRFLVDGGVRVTMQTGGRGLTLELAKELKAAGMAAIGVSIDGPAEVHDALRASKGSHAAALRALDNARAVRLPTTSNIQVNNLNKHLLRQTCAEVRKRGIRVWRPQLTVAMGRAADRPDWILKPWDIIEVMDTLAQMQLEALEEARAKGIPASKALNIQAGNNIGYYGPHEQLLRSEPGGSDAYWQGCQAGRFTMGIESDGKVKGCPSLPSAPYIGGNIRDLTLEQLWDDTEELNFVQTRTTDELWGFCKSCYYADVCRAGCSFTAHCTLGRRGNNPFCYHRAATLKKQGKRERLVQAVKPEGVPYDFGRFEVIEEPWVD